MRRATGAAGSDGHVAAPVAGRAPAPLRRRLAALAYESLLAAALVLIAGFVFAPLVSPTGGSGRSLQLPDLPSRVVEFCLLFAAGAWYCVWSWTEGRRTLPMKTWHIAIVTVAGEAPARRTALGRYLALWVGPACALIAYAGLRPWGLGAHAAWLLALNYLWAFVDPDRLFLHDRIAGTRLVRTA